MKKKTKKELKQLRTKIDGIDARILSLLNGRAGLVKRIGKAKMNSGGGFYAPHREKMIISLLASRNKGPLNAASVESIFREIVSVCRALESKIKVAYLGPEATFTHQAAIKNFGAAAEYLPAKSIGDVFNEVEKGRADYGVVPIENSTDGAVYYTLDMFGASDLSICSEFSMRIEECLLSRASGAGDIKKVYSIASALGQCRQWIEDNLPGVRIQETLSTVNAAQKASKEKNSAAIGPRAAAALHGLDVLAAGIEDSKENHTRFLVLGHAMADRSGQDKTSIMVSLKDRVGALHDMLVPFKKNRISLTKIESRPTKKKAWEYVFFIDFLGHVSEKRVQKALKGLEKGCSMIKVLGSYPKAE
ncbi:MAG: prephenate dehydratase [Elusimicrobiota bacterium]